LVITFFNLKLFEGRGFGRGLISNSGVGVRMHKLFVLFVNRLEVVGARIDKHNEINSDKRVACQCHMVSCRY